MDCKICFEEYDNFERKPFSAMPCGHSFCRECIDNLKKEKYDCPICRNPIVSSAPNFSLMEILSMKSENFTANSQNNESKSNVNLTKALVTVGIESNSDFEELKFVNLDLPNIQSNSNNDDIELLVSLKYQVLYWKNISNQSNSEIYEKLLSMCDGLSTHKISKKTFKEQLHFLYSLYLDKARIDTLDNLCQALSDKYDYGQQSNLSNENENQIVTEQRMFASLTEQAQVEPIVYSEYLKTKIGNKLKNLVHSWYLKRKLSSDSYKKISNICANLNENDINKNALFDLFLKYCTENFNNKIEQADKDEFKSYLDQL